MNAQVSSPAVNGTSNAAPASAAAAPAADPFTIHLRKPLTTHEGQTRVLKLREPVAADFIAMGKLPFKTRGSGDAMEVDVFFDLAAKWLSRLSGVDEILIGQMGRMDWLTAVGRLNEILVTDGDDEGN